VTVPPVPADTVTVYVVPAGGGVTPPPEKLAFSVTALLGIVNVTDALDV